MAMLFLAKNSDAQGVMGGRVVMVKQPVLVFPQSSPFVSHRSHESVESLFVNMLIDCLSIWQKFHVHNAFDIKEAISMTFTLDFDILTFFGRGDPGDFH